MSKYRKIPDWEWLSEMLKSYKILDRRTNQETTHDAFGFEAELYSQIRRRYVSRKKPHYVKEDKTTTSEEYENSKRIHSKQIAVMDKMGYSLMLDGDTFYKRGYELDPYMMGTFDMHQAYEITKFVEAQS